MAPPRIILNAANHIEARMHLLFSAYASFVNDTGRIYLKRDRNIVLLGLLGEMGEVSEHVLRVLRDDDGTLTDARADAIATELGDVLWYVFAFEHEYGLDAPGSARCWEPSFLTMEQFTAAEPRDGEPDPVLDTFELGAEVGLLAKLIAQSPGSFLRPASFGEAREHLYRIMRCIDRIARWTGLNGLADVAARNIAKLAERRVRASGGVPNPGLPLFGWVDIDADDATWERQSKLWAAAVAEWAEKHPLAARGFCVFSQTVGMPPSGGIIATHDPSDGPGVYGTGGLPPRIADVVLRGNAGEQGVAVRGLPGGGVQLWRAENERGVGILYQGAPMQPIDSLLTPGDDVRAFGAGLLGAEGEVMSPPQEAE